MKWYEILGSAGFWCVIIGIGGLGGAIEFGTGWEASMAFLGLGSALVGVAADEYGERGKDIMVYQIENRMVVDSAWDEIEYGVPSSRRMKRERQAYEEAEREDRENEYIV